MAKGLNRTTLSLLGTIAVFCTGPAFAEQYYDAGLKSFQSRKYAEAAKYFEESIKVAPWESNAFYYCALAYHYKGDFKSASDKYGQCVERFPGTPACNQSMDALKAIDPQYFKRRADAIAKADAANKVTYKAGPAGSAGSSASSEKDKGTIEGESARVAFSLKGEDRVVECTVNGRSTRAIFDKNGENTVFSRQQLASLAINPPKGATEFKCDIKIGGITRKGFPLTIDDAGQAARIGTSFTDAFNVTVDDGGKFVDLKKKNSGGAAAASLKFTKDGKDLVVAVDVNGRPTQMAFDPNESGVNFNTKQAKAAGLKVDDAESQHKAPGEGPQRGDANWVPDEDRAAAPKIMSIRMKVGPVIQQAYSCQISETSTAKYPKFGADVITGGGYKYEIDYKTSTINFTRR